MTRDWSSYLSRTLAAKESAGLLRHRGGGFLETAPSRRTKHFIDFGSNDYLGLRRNADVLRALSQSSSLGSGASPVLGGHCVEHQAVEKQLASLSGFDSALVFSGGYACNIGTISSLASDGDLLLSDQLNHASLIDGCRLSKAKTQVYRHNDVKCLHDLLKRKRNQYDKALIVTESVFSMDGDIACLESIADLADEYRCGLIVDEAHATGIYGARGSGLVEELQLQDRVLAKLGTLSKSVGSVGGFACGSTQLVEYLVNHCRSYIFSTAPPVAVMKATKVALELLENMRDERDQLRRRASTLRSRLVELGWQFPAAACSADRGESPIIPLVVGEEGKAMAISESLLEKSIYVPAIRPPTVPAGASRLRISLSATHSDQEIEALVQALSHCSRKI